MKKTLITILLASIIMVPLSSYALNTNDVKDGYRVVTVIKNKFKSLAITEKLNVKGYVYNSKGKFKIKDALTVTKNALFKKDVDVAGELSVQGTISGSNFTNVEDINLVEKDSLIGGEIYYNQADSTLYVYNGISFVDLTQQDTDTDTNTTYTAGDNITISEAGVITATDTNTSYSAGTGITITDSSIAADLGTSITASEIDTDAVGSDELSSSAITQGDIGDSDLPLSGSWNISGSLNIDSGTLYIDPTLNRVGIGSILPESALHVEDGFYAQFEQNGAGAPGATDCDSDAERGRLYIDITSNYLYICNGQARAWDYVSLTN